MPGEYEFGTMDKEIMEVLGGKLNVQLPGSSAVQSFEAGQSFEVPANNSFKVSADEFSDFAALI